MRPFTSHCQVVAIRQGHVTCGIRHPCWNRRANPSLPTPASSASQSGPTWLNVVDVRPCPVLLGHCGMKHLDGGY